MVMFVIVITPMPLALKKWRVITENFRIQPTLGADTHRVTSDFARLVVRKLLITCDP